MEENTSEIGKKQEFLQENVSAVEEWVETDGLENIT